MTKINIRLADFLFSTLKNKDIDLLKKAAEGETFFIDIYGQKNHYRDFNSLYEKGLIDHVGSKKVELESILRIDRKLELKITSLGKEIASFLPDLCNETANYRLKINKNSNHLIKVKEFIDSKECGALIDYDGHGHPVKDNLEDTEIFIVPSKAYRIPRDATHIMWYNR